MVLQHRLRGKQSIRELFNANLWKMLSPVLCCVLHFYQNTARENVRFGLDVVAIFLRLSLLQYDKHHLVKRRCKLKPKTESATVVSTVIRSQISYIDRGKAFDSV